MYYKYVFFFVATVSKFNERLFKEKTRIRNAQLREQIESERRRSEYIESTYRRRPKPIEQTVTQTTNSKSYGFVKAGGFAAGGAAAGAMIAGPPGEIKTREY